MDVSKFWIKKYFKYNKRLIIIVAIHNALKPSNWLMINSSEMLLKLIDLQTAVPVNNEGIVENAILYKLENKIGFIFFRFMVQFYALFRLFFFYLNCGSII